MTTEKIKDALRAIQTGDKTQGRKLLIESVRSNPQDEDAWLCLADVVEDTKQREECLERVLKINPQNERARLGLAKIRGRKERFENTSPDVANRSKLFWIGGRLLLLGLIVLGALWFIREKKTEVVAVDMNSVMNWGLIDKDIVAELGRTVRNELVDDSRKQLATDAESYNQYVYWNNAELLGFEGYVRARLPVSSEDVNSLQLHKAVFLFEFSGVVDINTIALESKYVLVEATVTNQEPVEFEIKRYQEQSRLPITVLFSCPTYAFEDCDELQSHD